MSGTHKEELDQFERAILAALQANGRLSVQELAEQIGLSSSPTWRRLKSLEERGFIKDYIAQVEPSKLGYAQVVFANVTLAKHNHEAIEAFEQAILERPEVLEFYSMTGAGDYLIRTIVKSTADYERFLKEVVFVSPAVQHVHSNFALREIKNTSAVPV